MGSFDQAGQGKGNVVFKVKKAAILSKAELCDINIGGFLNELISAIVSIFACKKFFK